MGKYDIGSIHKTNEGYDIEIIEKYKGEDKSKIKFLDNGIEKVVCNGAIRRGVIHNPNHELDSCCVGSRHTNNNGEWYTVIERIDNNLRVIEFDEPYKTKREVFTSAIKSGNIKNNFSPSVYGKGILGTNEVINTESNTCYRVWALMLKRCFSEEYKQRNPTYRDVTVCDEWLLFTNFREWFNINYIQGFELDKDLIGDYKESKVYSPDTCVFIPHNVNTFLVYKNYSDTSGISLSKSKNRYIVNCNTFMEDTNGYIGSFGTREEALECYNNHRKVQAEKVKDYLRSLNYLPEEIIQLIK